MKKTDKDKNPEKQGQEQKIQNPQDYFLISLSLSSSHFQSFSLSPTLSPLFLRSA